MDYRFCMAVRDGQYLLSGRHADPGSARHQLPGLCRRTLAGDADHVGSPGHLVRGECLGHPDPAGAPAGGWNHARRFLRRPRGAARAVGPAKYARFRFRNAFE
jgi:hypothetical protein